MFSLARTFLGVDRVPQNACASVMSIAKLPRIRLAFANAPRGCEPLRSSGPRWKQVVSSRMATRGSHAQARCPQRFFSGADGPCDSDGKRKHYGSLGAIAAWRDKYTSEGPAISVHSRPILRCWKPCLTWPIRAFPRSPCSDGKRALPSERGD